MGKCLCREIIAERDDLLPLAHIHIGGGVIDAGVSIVL